MQRNTFFGSALFGVGWGLNGVCPGRPSPASARATSTCCGRLPASAAARAWLQERIRGAGGRGRLAGKAESGHLAQLQRQQARGVRPRAAANPQQPIRDARAPAAALPSTLCSRSIATAIALQLDAPSAAWPQRLQCRSAGRAGAAPRPAVHAVFQRERFAPMQRVGGAPGQQAEALADRAADRWLSRRPPRPATASRGGIDRQPTPALIAAPLPSRAPASRSVSGWNRSAAQRPSSQGSMASSASLRAKAMQIEQLAHRARARVRALSARKASIASGLARFIGELLALERCGAARRARAAHRPRAAAWPRRARRVRVRRSLPPTRSGACALGSSRARLS